MQVLVTYGSTYMLVTLSLDRLDAVRNPLSFGQRENHATRLVAGAWLISAIFSLPAIFLNNRITVRGLAQCWIQLEPWQWRFYITIVCLTLFCVPALIIAYCYVMIVLRIWRKPLPIALICTAKPVEVDTNKAATNNLPYENRLSLRLNYDSESNRDQTAYDNKVDSIDFRVQTLAQRKVSAPNLPISGTHRSCCQTNGSTYCDACDDHDRDHGPTTPAVVADARPSIGCNWLDKESSRKKAQQKTKRTVQMRFSSEGVIPKARIKTIKMTFVIVLGKYKPIFCVSRFLRYFRSFQRRMPSFMRFFLVVVIFVQTNSTGSIDSTSFNQLSRLKTLDF